MTTKTPLSPLRIVGFLILILSLLFGCAAKKSLWGDAKTGFILKYRMEPDQVFTYHNETTEFTTLEMMGQSMETETNRPMTYSIKVTGLDDNENYLTEITIDSIYWRSHSMQGDQEADVKSLIGESFGLTLSPLGKRVEFENMDRLPEIDLGQMAGTRDVKSLFESLLVELSQNPIKIGDSWKMTEESTENRNNLDITTIAETVNTLEGYETIGDTECLKIKSQTTGTLDGSGNMRGMDMVLEGDIEGPTTWFFDYKTGVLVKAISEIIVEATIAISGQANMTIPMVTESNSIINLIR